MTAPERESASDRATRVAWRVTGFLAVAGALNYADRAATSVVFPPLQADLHLSNVALGLLGATFLWSYAVCSPFAGALADRLPRDRLVIWSLALWSFVTALTGVATGLVMLLILRVALGMAESLFLPSAIALLSDHHGTATRGKAMSTLSVGLSVGMIAGGASAGYLAQQYGWRSGFLVLGVVGAGIALVARRYLTPGQPRARTVAPSRPSVRVSLRYLARVPTFHLLLTKTMLAGIGTWIFYNWMPLYFHEAFGLGLGAAGFAGTFMLSIWSMAGMAAGGWLSDRFAVRDPRHRVLFLALSYFAATPFLLVFLGKPSLTAVSVALAMFSVLRGLGAANENPALCDVVPPQFRSTAVGFMNCLATAAGGAGVAVTGLLKGRFGLGMVFAGVSAAIFCAGFALLLGYFFCMRRDVEKARAYAES